MKTLFFLIFFVLIFSFETSAFPKKKDAVLKNLSTYHLEEELVKSGYLNSLISFCNFSSKEAKLNKTYFKELKGFIGYVNWDLFKYFNSGVSIFNLKKDKGYGLIKRINWMYKIKGCESQSLDIATKNNLEIIQNEILPFILNATMASASYSQTIEELKQKLLVDKKSNYSVFVNQLDLKESENTTQNQEIEESQIEKADKSETNNQLDLTETEDIPQEKVDNELTVSLEEAKQILILIQEFLLSNPTEFDIVALTTLIQKNKEVLQDSWSNEQQDNFRELYDFLFQSDAFSNFKIAKDVETRKVKEEAIKQERVSLDQNISLLKDYLTQNMFADDAPQVLKMIEAGESLQSSENIEELKTINTKINSFLNEKSIKEENTQNNSDNSSSSINQKVENVLNNFNSKDNSETDNLISGDTATIESNQSEDPNYLNEVGQNYFTGDGVKIDKRKAIELWEIAAEKGLSKAQHNLGMSYFKGEGVRKNLKIAYMWTVISIAENLENTKFSLYIGDYQRKRDYIATNNEIEIIREDLLKIWSELKNLENVEGRNVSSAGASYADKCWRAKFVTHLSEKILAEKNDPPFCESSYLFSDETEDRLIKSGLPYCSEDYFVGVRRDKCFDVIYFNISNEFDEITCEGGLRYEGGFKYGYEHFTGTFVNTCDDREYDKFYSEFQDGISRGYGEIYFTNGNIYKGGIEQGMEGGIGTLTFTDGSEKSGLWENGDFIKETSNKISDFESLDEIYVVVTNTNVREEPNIDGKKLIVLEKGTIINVVGKVGDDWLQIKEIKNNFDDQDIGKILGFSFASNYELLENIYNGKPNTDNNKLLNLKLPGKMLLEAYESFMILEKLHEVREGYAVVYVNDIELSKAKSQLKEIEYTLVNSFNLEKELIKKISEIKYSNDYKLFDQMYPAGVLVEEGKQAAALTLILINDLFDKISSN